MLGVVSIVLGVIIRYWAVASSSSIGFYVPNIGRGIMCLSIVVCIRSLSGSGILGFLIIGAYRSNS